MSPIDPPRMSSSTRRPPFLEAEAAPWAVRGLATFLIALFVVAVLAAALIRVPETVTSRFVLVPLHGADPVRVAPRRLR